MTVPTPWRTWFETRIRGESYLLATHPARGGWFLVREPDPGDPYESDAPGLAARLEGLSHPGVAAVVEVTPARVVCAWSAGRSVRELLRAAHRAGGLPRDEALEVTARLADAYAWAHARVGRHDGALDADDARVGPGCRVVAHTPWRAPLAGHSATVLGRPAWTPTLRFMSREAVLGQRTDARADVYSLAAIAHELLLGAPAVDGASDPDRLFAVVKRAGPLAPLEAARGRLSGALTDVLQRALAVDAGARYADLAAFADALRPFTAPSHHRAPRVDTTPPLDALAARITDGLAPDVAQRAALWSAHRDVLLGAVADGRVGESEAVVLVTLAAEARGALADARRDPTTRRASLALLDALLAGDAPRPTAPRRVRLGAVEVEVCAERWDAMRPAGARDGMEARRCDRCGEDVVRVAGLDGAVLAVGRHCTRVDA